MSAAIRPERRCFCGAPLGPRELQCACCREPDCVHRKVPARPFLERDPLIDASSSFAIPKLEQVPSAGVLGLLTIPWSALVSDNQRSGVRTKKGEMVGIGTTRAYRKAKQNLHAAALAWWHARPLIGRPVFVHARAFVPDDRERDVGNMRKLVLDALQGAVYESDRQVHDERWTRVGIDRENPRLELTIRSL